MKTKRATAQQLEPNNTHRTGDCTSRISPSSMLSSSLILKIRKLNEEEQDEEILLDRQAQRTCTNCRPALLRVSEIGRRKIVIVYPCGHRTRPLNLTIGYCQSWPAHGGSLSARHTGNALLTGRPFATDRRWWRWRTIRHRTPLLYHGKLPVATPFLGLVK